MREVLEFIFQTPYHWMGSVIILLVLVGGVVQVTTAILTGVVQVVLALRSGRRQELRAEIENSKVPHGD